MASVHQSPVEVERRFAVITDVATSTPGASSTATTGVIKMRVLKEEGTPFGFRVAWCLPPRYSVFSGVR